MKGLSRSAIFYRRNKKARDKKLQYDLKYHSTPARRKYRAKLNTERRRRKMKGDPRDLSHTKDRRLVPESRERNRGRQGANGKSTLK